MISLSAYPRVVVFTGAGMSAESGVPTYRGRGGIWNQYRYEDYACTRECGPHIGPHNTTLNKKNPKAG
jgi:NAD-dependent SIR2 family protein deacetylase